MIANSRLGPYEVLGPIGVGGMGEVYRGRDTRLGRDVAIKVLPPAVAGETDPSAGPGSSRAASRDERLARFKREAQTLAALNHPNIAAIYGVEESPAAGEGHPAVRALVMEFVDGDDLSVLLARGPLALEDAVPIARQIAEALEAAHDHGIVHRDLKPANVKVRPDGTVKVLDFGLAKVSIVPGAGHDTAGTASPTDSPTSTSPVMTQLGVVMGTAAYMSPEQAKGRPVDRRADIWAFGVVLYEMLSGTRLFQAGSTAETLANVLTREPDLPALSRQAPAPIVALLRRCLERDPRKRLRDIGEARLVLEDPRTLEPPVALVSPAPAPTSRRLTIGRLLVAALAGALCFALGFGTASMTRRPSAVIEPQRPLSVTPVTASGNVISATVSPDGRYIVYVESEQGMQSLWLQQVAGGQTLRLVPEQRASYWSHTFTPDGNSIVFGLKKPDDLPGALYAISTLGGVPRRLVGDIDSAPTYSPDGRRMAFLRSGFPADGATALMVAGADGTEAKPLLTVRLPDHVAGIFFGGPAWSPDGKTIVTAMNRRASTTSDMRARLVQVSVDTGEMNVFSDPGWVMAAQAAWMPDGRSLLVIARAPNQTNAQIWSVSFPDGRARPVTADLNDRRIVSLTRDGRTLVTVAGIITANVLVSPLRGDGRAVRVSRSTLDGLRGVALTREGRVVYSSNSSEGPPGYISTRGGNSVFWRASPDGADRSPLLASEGVTLAFPVVADDGTIYHLAYTPSGTEVRAAPGDGGKVRVLARDARFDSIGASSDGTVLVYGSTHEGAPHLFRLAPGGAAPTQISTFPSFSPSVDSSGRRVAFYYINAEGRFRLGVASTDGGALLADLPADTPTTNSRLVLTEEGVYANTMPGDRANVWLVPLDGRPARRVTSYEDQIVFDFAVSRDGASLAVVRGPRLRDAQMITGFASNDSAADAATPTP